MPGLGNAVDASTTGFQSLNAATGVWVGRSLIAGSGINITNINGVAGNPTISSTAFTTVAIQIFTANGTYTPTVGMAYCEVEMLGGGGGGGGSVATAAGQFSCGSGGGAGEFAQGVFNAAAIGVSQAVTIGSGGTGVLAATGNSGGNTSLGALISAFGGSGGQSAPAGASSNRGGGLGGTGGAGGFLRTPGYAGGHGVYSFVAALLVTGQGADSQLGAGGLSATYIGGANGTNALGFGAGGSGSSSALGVGVAFTGGSGTGGIIKITEYII